LNRKLTAIYGGPGSGKTAELIRHILDSTSNPSDISSVGMVTYTRAAAHEARARIRRSLNLEDDSLLPYFRTVHSTCYFLLGLNRDCVANNTERRIFAKSKGMSMTKVSDVDVTELDTYALQPEFMTDGDILFGIYDWCSSRDLDPMQEYRKCPVLRYARSEFNGKVIEDFLRGWTEFKLGGWTAFDELRRDYAGPLYDFFDMLRGVISAGLSPPVKHWYWDEFQDNYPLLYKVYQIWTASPGVESITIAGDPNQTIYTFAGADPSFFLHELERADDKIPLTESHRCSDRIMAFSNILIESIPTRQRVQWQMTTKTPGGIVETLPYYNVPGTAWSYAMSGESVYILCRTNRQADDVGKELTREGIPNTRLKAGEHDTRSAWTRAVPQFLASLRKFLAGESMGVGEIRTLVDVMPSGGDPQTSIVKYGYKEKLACGQLSLDGRMTTSEIMKYLWPETPNDVVKRVSQVLDASAKYECLAVALKKAFTRKEDGGWGGLELPFDPNLIKIGTMHASKGKEADVTIAVLWMPRPVSEGILYDRNLLYEEIRVNYVASTRPRRALYIVYPEEFNVVNEALIKFQVIGNGNTLQ